METWKKCGHPKTQANTSAAPSKPGGECRTCQQIRQRAWRKKHRKILNQRFKVFRAKNLERYRTRDREYKRVKSATDDQYQIDNAARQRAVYWGETYVKTALKPPSPGLVKAMRTVPLA